VPEARDYGISDGKTLVPGTLTVFRHYLADLRSGGNSHLLPMSAGSNPANVKTAWDRPYPHSGQWVAECGSPLGVLLHQVRPSLGEDHKSPDVNCTCGFYASYDPATDFYPTFRWGGYHSNRDRRIIVRAVVEASGTVVMGRLGVRAEKMKVVALAVDWSKHVSGYTWEWMSDAFPSLVDQARDEKRAVRTRVHELAEELANLYGAKLYDTVFEMNEAHPKADISALGVDTSPRPHPGEHFDWATAAIAGSSLNRQIAQQAAAYANVGGFTPVVRTVLDEAVAVGDATPYEKALARKAKGKPAPPGTGIDRRRGKLR
jgi:hypothetical protein